MLVSIPTLVILVISAFFSSVIAGMFGMGGGILFLGILASLVETSYVVPLHAVISAISTSSRVLLFIKHINWRIFGFYIIGLLPGALMGIFVFNLLPKGLIKLLMGVFILAAVFVPVSKRKGRLSKNIFIIVGLVAGFSEYFSVLRVPLQLHFISAWGL